MTEAQMAQYLSAGVAGAPQRGQIMFTLLVIAAPSRARGFGSLAAGLADGLRPTLKTERTGRGDTAAWTRGAYRGRSVRDQEEVSGKWHSRS